MTTKSKTGKPNVASAKTSARKKPKTQRRTGVAPKKAASQKREIVSLRENTKLATVIAMLRRKEGATIEQLVKATGWQSHSVRGAMSGALKKKLGLEISSTKVDGVRTYRLTA